MKYYLYRVDSGTHRYLSSLGPDREPWVLMWDSEDENKKIRRYLRSGKEIPDRERNLAFQNMEEFMAFAAGNDAWGLDKDLCADIGL